MDVIDKQLSASGGEPLPPDQGLCPWIPMGAKPPGPIIRPLFQFLDPPVDAQRA